MVIESESELRDSSVKILVIPFQTIFDLDSPPLEVVVEEDTPSSASILC